MPKKRIKAFGRILGIGLLGELDDRALVVEQQQVEELVELEDAQPAGHGGGAYFGWSLVHYGRTDCYWDAQAVVFDIYLSLGVYLHLAVKVLLFAPTISPVGYMRRFVFKVGG